MVSMLSRPPRRRNRFPKAATEPCVDMAMPVCWVDLGAICTVIVFSRPNCLAVISSLASVHPDIHVTLCVAVSDANTFLTSDWDMPNCRAICDGLMPALTAARTAFTCPRVNEIFANSACRWSFDGDCFRTNSSVEFGGMLGSNRPRRFASSTDADMSRSSSLSVRYLTALGGHWVAHAVSKPCPLLLPWQRPALLAAEKHLEPYRSRTDRVLLGECGHAPWWQDRGSITDLGVPRCGAQRIEVFRRASKIHVFQWWAETFLTHRKEDHRAPNC